MWVHLALLLVSAGLIYVSCELFVNGVEWVGRTLRIGRTAVGSVLAAFGTALPESVVTFVAVAFGRDAAAKDIGVGAALGGPLVLSTLAYSVVGLVLWFQWGKGAASKAALARVDGPRLAQDQGWFLLIFAAKVALGLVAFHWKRWLGLLFLGAYALYSWKELTRDDAADDDTALEPLKLRPGSASPGAAWSLLQTVGALGAVFVASRLFVSQLGHVGPWLGLPPATVALLLSPIATELPETLNAVIWVRKGKTQLALANISGAMMIQATVPSAFGLFFTPWRLAPPLLLAAAVTALAVLPLLAMFRARTMTALRLSAVGLLYGAFAIGMAILGA